MKKRLAYLLAMAMGLSVLAGCGGGGAETGGDSGSGGASAGGNVGSGASTENGGGTDADAGAENGGAGSAGVEIDFDEEPYEATLMYWVGNDARDLESVEAAFNELTLSQLNMKVNLMPMTMGTYIQQIQMVLSSDDDLDVFPFFGSNMGGYIDAEYLIDMSGYMDTYGQDLVEIIGEEDIECGKLNDFLAGVPNMHERTNPVIFVLRTDLLEESGFQAEDISGVEDLTQVFAAVHEKHPEITIYGGQNTLAYPLQISVAVMDPLGGGNFGVLPDEGQSTTVVNWYETEEFTEACKLMRSWYEAGYVSADFATCTDTGESLMRAGNLFCFSTAGKPNSKAEKDAMTGYDTTIIKVTPDACYTQTTNALLYGISGNSEDPEKAMLLLNWIYATKEANDLLNWGIEGKDYVVTEDGTIDYPEGVTIDNVGYHQDTGWAQLNQYNSYVWTGNDADVWDQYQAVRDSAIMSKAYGFFFDTTPVLNELSALTAVSEEYLTTIGSGSVDPEAAIAEFNEKLYAAGLQTVIDEKQEQLDAWLAEQ
ncbi:MAG: ABC transporter substrate-binding protein [Roseburia sp.]|jgi:putative aldouronate transport system substrate-binding protein|nr:ABC transporter substrate-binding protein [Roseburia sp.]